MAKKKKNLSSTTGDGDGRKNAPLSLGAVADGGDVVAGYPVGMSGALLVHSEWTRHASYRVTFDDVLTAFALACHETDPVVRDAVVFRMFDVDGDGVVTYDDLFYIFKNSKTKG